MTSKLTFSATALLTAALTACGGGSDDTATQTAGYTKPPSQQLSEAAGQAITDYETDAETFVRALDDGETPAALSALAQTLLDQAQVVAPEFIRVFPSCQAHLSAALEIVNAWPTLPPEQIETDYHEGRALPPINTGSNCYHMKDVIVHPATALALLKQPKVDRGQVRNEIAEVIAHAVAVRTGVGFNASHDD